MAFTNHHLLLITAQRTKAATKRAITPHSRKETRYTGLLIHSKKGLNLETDGDRSAYCWMVEGQTKQTTPMIAKTVPNASGPRAFMVTSHSPADRGPGMSSCN